MEKKILIVEDESLVAFDLKLILTRAGYKVCGIADSVKEALEIIEEQSPEMVLLDIFLKGSLSGIDLAKMLTAKNIAFVYLSANFQESILEKAKTTQPYGFLVKPFREKELLVALDVAFYRHSNSMESKLRQEQAIEHDLRKIVDEPVEWRQKMLKIAGSLQPYVPFDYLSITIKNASGVQYGELSFLRIGFNEYQVIGVNEFLNITRLSMNEWRALQEKNPLSSKSTFFNQDDFTTLCQRQLLRKKVANTFHLESLLNLPLLTSRGEILNISFYSRKNDCYTFDHLNLLSHLQRSLVAAIEDTWVIENAAIPEVKEEIAVQHPESASPKTKFDGLIGKSHQMLGVQDMVSIVAPLDTSVLILGESGTGKERIAKSIHQLSNRSTKSLVIVNCASLPVNLIESELFGHEKGAFTGAIEKRIGKFELADKGTIFLDEIGEMPIELQVKLLRVLQEQEIERIGGKAPIKINVRIIAATNRNLEKEVEEGRFRLDLYYRLYVFPIMIAPLRERKDDIPILTNHFINIYSCKTGKNVSSLSSEVLGRLLDYHWPGNVRELEHLIERSVLLANGSVIKDVLLPMFQNRKEQINLNETPVLKTIDENARDHIVNVLKKCNGRISGPGGAAEILEVPPSTLHYKIKKLGIKKWDS